MPCGPLYRFSATLVFNFIYVFAITGYPKNTAFLNQVLDGNTTNALNVRVANVRLDISADDSLIITQVFMIATFLPIARNILSNLSVYLFKIFGAKYIER